MKEQFYVKRLLRLPPVLTSCLPKDLVDALQGCGAPFAEEIRLYVGRVASISACGKRYPTKFSLDEPQMQEILRRMCGNSLYAYRDTLCAGYLSIGDGIRVGVCGHAAMEGARVIGVREVTGLVIRIPNRVRVSAAALLELLFTNEGKGLLLYAPPGVGKTTLLRAIAGQAASDAYGLNVVVVDTREELACSLEGAHLSLNVLSGYPRGLGIEIAVRSLGAELIVCDEIGDESDAKSILESANRGVPIVASAHASSCEELLSRPSLERLHAACVFGSYVGLQRDASNHFQYQIHTHKEASERILRRKEQWQ